MRWTVAYFATHSTHKSFGGWQLLLWSSFALGSWNASIEGTLGQTSHLVITDRIKSSIFRSNWMHRKKCAMKPSSVSKGWHKTRMIWRQICMPRFVASIPFTFYMFFSYARWLHIIGIIAHWFHAHSLPCCWTKRRRRFVNWITRRTKQIQSKTCNNNSNNQQKPKQQNPRVSNVVDVGKRMA